MNRITFLLAVFVSFTAQQAKAAAPPPSHDLIQKLKAAAARFEAPPRPVTDPLQSFIFDVFYNGGVAGKVGNNEATKKGTAICFLPPPKNWPISFERVGWMPAMFWAN